MIMHAYLNTIKSIYKDMKHVVDCYLADLCKLIKRKITMKFLLHKYVVIVMCNNFGDNSILFKIINILL